MLYLNSNPHLRQTLIYYKSKQSDSFYTSQGIAVFTAIDTEYTVLGYGYHDDNTPLDVAFIEQLLTKNINIVYVCTQMPVNAIKHDRIVYVETKQRWFSHLLFKNPQGIKAVFHNNVTSAKVKAKLFASQYGAELPVITDSKDLPILKQISKKLQQDKTFVIETYDGMGDVLMSLPTAKTLHSLGWKVQYSVEPGNASILDNLDFVDKVYTSSTQIPLHLVKSYVSLSGRLSEYSLDFNKQHRVYSTAYLCGLRNQDLVTLKPTIVLSKEEKEYATELLKKYKKTVGVCWYSYSSHRSYFRDYTQKLCTKLTSLGYTPIMLGTQKFKFEDCIDLVGKTSMRQLFALINQLDCVITADTGVLHVAGALDKPTIAIMGHIPAEWRCSTYKNCYPLVPDKTKVPCYPCSDRQWVAPEDRMCTQKEEGYCLRTITPDVILDKFKEISKSNKPLILAKESKEAPFFMEGYAGIGDNFWQRPFIKDFCKDKELYLMTFTPQVYWDIPNLKPVRTPHKGFKHHNKLADKMSKDLFYPMPSNYKKVIKPEYWKGFKKGLSIGQQFQKVLPITTYDFSFTPKQEWIDRAKTICKKIYIGHRKLCIVHFPTQRREWRCPARDPKPGYMQLLIDKYKKEYFFISIADLEFEYFTKKPKNIDYAFHRGELSLEDLFGLVKLADMVISPNCYLLPMALATGTRTFGLYGGCQKPELYLEKGMDLSKYGQVTPEPFCNCFRPDHKCNKEIPEDKIINNFEELKNRVAKKKKLLIYRVGAKYHRYFRDNSKLNEKYQLIFQKDPVANLEEYIDKIEPDSVVSVDYPPETLKKICQQRDINWLFNEAFLGEKNVFDRTGAHFDPSNDIKKYIDSIKINKKPNIPSWTKVRQPQNITKKELFKKYGLSYRSKYIVLLGQEVCDKSIIHSKNTEIKDYKDYIHHLVTNNLDTTFLFKAHPVYNTIKKRDAQLMDYIYNYKNIVKIDENINSLFSIFDNFTTYSSTTTFEGLIQNKKFATVGYHFCDNDKLVFQMRTLEDFKDLYKKLDKFKIDQKVKDKFIYFICNYYSIFCDSDQLVDRLELSSEEYFKKEY